MIEIINFQKSNGLIPVIIQEGTTGEVLMLGYMNKEALQRTLKEGFVHFWSRKRKRLWRKGEESGNGLKVESIFIDCDGDALLIKARLLGKNVCHKGTKSCFFETL